MTNIKDNLTAIIIPGLNNDTTQGYAPGSEWFDIAGGKLWKCVDATAGAARWIQLDTDYPAWPAGYYRIPAHIAQVSDSSAITADLLTMQPVLIPRRVTIDRITLRQVTLGGTGAAARLGLYAADPGTGLPSALELDAGARLLDDYTGDRFMSVSKTLEPGLYWTACILKNVTTMPVLRRIGGANFGHFPATSLDNLGSAAATRYLSAVQSYGPLPAVAPAMTADAGSHGPILGLRRSL